jgi:hypothetical protein
MTRLPLHRRLRAAILLALFTLAALAPGALASGADQPDGAEDGWRKVLAYARCTLLVATAITPPQWAGAVLDCARLYLAESSLAAGGR